MTLPYKRRITRAAEGLPRRRFTYSELVAMEEAEIIVPDERLELIGGELVPMSQKGLDHEILKQALSERWCCLPRGVCDVAIATELYLSEDTFLGPDVVIFPRAGGFAGLTPATALLVVEIADSSLEYDLGRKAELYASFGVCELWVIDAVKITARTFRTPSERSYGETRDYRASDQIVPLFAPAEFALRLDQLKLA